MDSENNFDDFECVCDKIINANNINSIMEHITQCQQYKNNSPFYKSFSKIPIQKIPFLHLIAMKAEFTHYLYLLEIEQKSRNISIKPPTNDDQQKLQDKNQQNVQDQDQQIENLKINSTLDLNDNNNNDSIIASNIQQEENKINQNDQLQCCKCLEQYNYDFMIFCECNDFYCKDCFKQIIQSEFIIKEGHVKCIKCQKFFSDYDIINNLGRDYFDQLTNQLIKKQYNIIQCIKCKQEIEFQKGDENSAIQNKDGKELSKELKLHYANNRFVCPNGGCKTEQCKNCQASPYHFGYTCQAYADFQQARKCRYCEQLIPNINNKVDKAIQDICKSKECQVKVKLACLKINKCNHPCCGYKDEKQCPPCLFEECGQKNNDLKQKGSEYCNICFIEGLINSPVVQSKCGHFFHYLCLQKSLQSKWITARIVFNFCHCPLCKQWLELPQDCLLQKDMNNYKLLFDDIKDKSMKRLHFEERFKDEKLVNPKSQFFKKPQEYAIAIYSYYMCFNCQNPYFGGLKDCERMLEETKKFNPKELICPNCCQIPFNNCQKHGVDFIEFKCKYCCTIAQWFCFGTTHFCEACHNKWQQVEELRKKGKLPKCPGKKDCPLKIDHKQNGEECELGCALCRNFKESGKEF